MIASQPKTKKNSKFDIGELIGQLLFDFYARYQVIDHWLAEVGLTL